MHLMHGSGIEGSEDQSGQLSAKIREAVDDLVGGGLTDRAWKQAGLPIRMGGFGVCDPVSAWPAARVAAVVGLWQNVERVGLPEEACKCLPPDWPASTAFLLNQQSPNFDPWCNGAMGRVTWILPRYLTPLESGGRIRFSA